MKKVVFQGILLLAGIALSNCEIEEPILQETKQLSLISPEGNNSKYHLWLRRKGRNSSD